MPQPAEQMHGKFRPDIVFFLDLYTFCVCITRAMAIALRGWSYIYILSWFTMAIRAHLSAAVPPFSEARARAGSRRPPPPPPPPPQGSS
jgi:hypothetical protein